MNILKNSQTVKTCPKSFLTSDFDMLLTKTGQNIPKLLETRPKVASGICGSPQCGARLVSRKKLKIYREVQRTLVY
jgi:hypothetical protein